MDMHTQSLAEFGLYTNAWFKATLDAEYCIERVILYWGSSYSSNDMHTCSPSKCSCVGGSCHRWTLSVYRQDGTVPGPGLPAGCKVGDIIKIQTIRTSDTLDVDELVIIPKLKLGELEYSSFNWSFFSSNLISNYSWLVSSWRPPRLEVNQVLFYYHNIRPMTDRRCQREFTGVKQASMLE